MDEEIDLTFYRPYFPNFARWGSRDPIEEAGGLNLYAYVMNEPISRWDKLGLFVVPTGQVKVDDDIPSIACLKGKLQVQMGTAYGAGAGCTAKHEQRHVKDWSQRFGPNLCKGVRDGYLPTGGPYFKEFFNMSECLAHKAGKKCREKERDECQDEELKKKLQDQIDQDEKYIKKFCR